MLCLQNGASFGKNQLMNGSTLAKPNLRLYNYKILQKRKKIRIIFKHCDNADRNYLKPCTQSQFHFVSCFLLENYSVEADLFSSE